MGPDIRNETANVSGIEQFSLRRKANRPLVMGVVNVTPDSFSDGGKYYQPEDAFKHAITLTEQGADIIDIGGESTRPGSLPVGLPEQIDRVCPVIEKIKSFSDIMISIDTTSSVVAEAAVKAGAGIINDISAMRFDDNMVNLVAGENIPVILMHMKGTPKDMQDDPHYDDIIEDIHGFFEERIAYAENNGVNPSKIVIDPGIGFGKTVEGNLKLLARINKFGDMGKPIMIGASRKSFIGKITGKNVDDRLSGSIAVACFCALNGVDILRVHDVKETIDALKIISALAGLTENA